MLKRKMLRDMKYSKVQFISIFLMPFLALFIFTGLGSETKGYREVLRNYYSETKMADLFLYGTAFSQQDISDISGLMPGAVVSGRLVIPGTMEFQNEPAVTYFIQDENIVSKPYLLEGSEFNPEDIDGIWIDKTFADARNLKLQDRVTIKIYGQKEERIIKGLIIHPEYIYKESDTMIPDNEMNAFAMISYQSVNSVIPLFYNQITIKYADNSADKNIGKTTDISVLEDDICQAIDSKVSVFVKREDLSSHNVFINEVDERKAMTEVFPIAFMAIALLTVLSTMSRMIQNQRTQIGVLRALGFSTGKIRNHFMGYALWLTLIGGISGSILGYLVLPKLFYGAMKTVYVLPEWKPSFEYTSFLITLVFVCTTLIISYLSIRSILTKTTASMLRPVPPKTIRIRWYEKSRLWTKTGFSFKWNIRDIRRSKLRSIMTIVGIAGCMGLLVVGFGCLDAFHGLINTKFDKIYQCKTIINLDENCSEETKNKLIKTYDAEEFMNLVVEIDNANVNQEEHKELTSLLISNELRTIQYLGTDWKSKRLDNSGICLSLKLAEELGVKIGDTVNWHILGDENWIRTEVSDIFRDPTEQNAIISKDKLLSEGYEFKPTGMYTKSENVEAQAGISSIQSVEKLKESIDSMLESMYFLIGIVCVAASVLAVVVLYNLGVLSYYEKEKELATLRVLGIQGSQIRRILLQQNVWLSLIALLPGYYFGYCILMIIMQFMGKEFDLSLKISLGSVLISIGITLFLSVFVNYIFSKRIYKLDMVGALKGVE